MIEDSPNRRGVVTSAVLGSVATSALALILFSYLLGQTSKAQETASAARTEAAIVAESNRDIKDRLARIEGKLDAALGNKGQTFISK